MKCIGSGDILENRDRVGSVIYEGGATESCVFLVIHLQRISCSDGESTSRDLPQ
jgi:hypothetical protein